MKLEHARELWQIRFLRILQLEQESFDFYKNLLTEKGPLLEKAGIQSILEKILQDEGRHIRIAKELIRLVNKKSEEGDSNGKR